MKDGATTVGLKDKKERLNVLFRRIYRREGVRGKSKLGLLRCVELIDPSALFRLKDIMKVIQRMLLLSSPPLVCTRFLAY